MPFRLLTARNGYEIRQYKVLAALFGQMRPPLRKRWLIAAKARTLA
jgi:hypothetical protein